jgi:hypothetical protein
VCCVLQGMTHIDTKEIWWSVHQWRKETRVGDGCSKRRWSRGRNQGASVLVERVISALFAGQRVNLGRDDIGKERKTVGGGY